MIEPNYIEIGTKEFSFTILNINPQKNFLPLTININGLSFGTLDSPTYMPSFIGDLKALLQAPFHKNYNLTIENFLENLCINQELIEHYRLTLEETFDDFSKIGVRNQESIFFLFKLHKNPFFIYPNLSEEIIYAEHVPINSVESALSELMKYVATLP
ncbi:hypothetical protein Acal01_00589 [Acinetobacter calcoaceticus]|uniref:hypothetical protein n=1 Tax=Acinetobacter calcoaceticus TaxID=471 RepID=UPI000314EB52|nr:hypothetical protein [Acinetobacter calcoaceticus]QSB54498.1 hypothetical protein I6J48_02115 [Acinetobacter calcoaceticus]